MDFIRQLDDGALWLAAVVAGLGAIGWLGRKAHRGYKALKPWVCRVGAVLDLAEYELQHNGGGSIKDSVSKIPQMVRDIAELKEGDRVLREGAVVIADRAAAFRAELADHVAQAASIHDEQAAAIAHLAEALPIVARSTPHRDDTDDTDDTQ